MPTKELTGASGIPGTLAARVRELQLRHLRIPRAKHNKVVLSSVYIGQTLNEWRGCVRSRYAILWPHLSPDFSRTLGAKLEIGTIGGTSLSLRNVLHTDEGLLHRLTQMKLIFTSRFRFLCQLPAGPAAEALEWHLARRN